MMRFRAGRLVVILLLALMTALPEPVAAQAGSIDPTFNPTPSNPLPTNVNFQQVIQPDGKILIYNAPLMFVNGELRGGMFRLNADGTTDTTFSYNNEGGVGITNLMIAPDGKIILAGSTSPNHAKMVRLNPDGSLDNGFSVLILAVGSPDFTGNWLTVNTIQSDGKVIATHSSWGNIQGTWYSYSMRRYNLDGTVDSSFNSPGLTGGHLVSTNPIIERLPDDKFYLAITSRSHLGGSLNVSRRMPDGSADPTYAPFSWTFGGSVFYSIEDLSIASDGGVLVTGQLEATAVGFPPRRQLRRYLPDGSPTPGFSAPLSFTGSRVQQLPDGKILYTASGGDVTRPLIRLNADGSVDNTYVLDPAITSIKNLWVVDPLNRPVFLATTTAGSALVRLLENGSLDPTFNPILGSVGTTSLVVTQPDDKVLVYGSFSHMNGVARNKFARLNADGSVDSSFNPGTAFDGNVNGLVIQPDGKIIAFGSFASYGGSSATRIVRMNSDGSIDNTFSVTITGSSVSAVALQSDGKMVIGGNFSQVGGESRKGLARLESNGALDAAFNPILGGSGYVGDLVVEPNGKIAICGAFTGVNGADRNNIARLEASGATDMTFNAGTPQTSDGLKRQPDGRYLSYGIGPTVERRNVDGSLDASFTSPVLKFNGSNGFITDLLLRPDGSILVAGEFNQIGNVSQGFITRLRRNGAADLSFLPTGANARVTSIAPAANSKIVVAGIFNSIEGSTRLGIARLNAPAIQSRTPFDFDGDGKADVSVYRPSSGIWYQLFSGGGPYGSPTFGLAGDIPVPADFDGDGKTDLAIFRPSSGDWWYRASSDGSLRFVHWGQNGDIPLPADINNDGKDDFVVFRPSNNYWYRITTTGVSDQKEFGLSGDKPVIGDFDGDGKADQAIFRPSAGDWWYSASSAGGVFRTTHWGQNGDIPAPADFDGDGKTDLAVFRPSNGAWYVFRSSDLTYIIVAFGLNGDRPAPGDYDGDGRADIAVFRPSTGVWYLRQTTSGTAGVQWGVSTDVAIPNAFVQP